MSRTHLLRPATAILGVALLLAGCSAGTTSTDEADSAKAQELATQLQTALGAAGLPQPSTEVLTTLYGEDGAFAYLRRIAPNVVRYTQSGTAQGPSVARGEVAVGVTFVHEFVTQQLAGFAVDITIPCEGTGAELGGMGLIGGAPHPEEAKIFYDWALTAPAQRLGFEAGGQLQQPSNREAPLPPNAPDLSRIRLIDYDFAKYGRAAERRRLIERWDREVGSLPR